MSTNETGAPVHKSGVIPATETAPPSGVEAARLGDPLAVLGGERRALFAVLADHLIPAAHGMPSAAEVVDDERLGFVLGARPDLLEPLSEALRPELGTDPAGRLGALERDEPAHLAALQLVIVGGYYTDSGVRELIGYPGQLAIEVHPWERPAYLEEGLIDAVVARGPVWRDPATGQRAVATWNRGSYAERFLSTAPNAGQGGHDGRHGTRD